MQFHEPFPIGTAATAVRERPAGNVPFGTRFALDVPETDAGAEARAEAERSYLDPDRQISLVEVDGVEVPVLRFDIADFPMNTEFTATLDTEWAGALRVGHRSLDLSRISGIYYRRPLPFTFPDDMTETHREWAAVEAKLGFLGTLAAVPQWLNHPARIANAEYKPLQLRLAKALGMLVPQAIVTNVPADARSFAESVGEVIYKPFSPRGVIEGGRQRLLYTVKVTPEQLDDPGISLTAHMVQEWIPHTHAIRMTVVDGACFTAEIHSDSPAADLDWRSDYESLTYKVTTPSAQVRNAVTAFMNELGLRFGALDFLVTPSGEWVFLEVNPNGQWAWIKELAPDIARALATALEKSPND